MASVHLKFVPPDLEDLQNLLIFESPSQNGLFTQIENVTAIGVYPTYIDEWTTTYATSVSNWFAIQWEDSKGAVSDISASVQGGVSTAISEVVSRVAIRDSSLNEHVILQEAEAAIQYVYPLIDPYDPTFHPSYVEMRGLTNLTLAMCYMVSMAQVHSSAWVAGIVSMKTSDTAIQQRADAIERLLKAANKDLGLNFSMIAYLEDLLVAGAHEVVSIDQTRLLVEIR